MDNPETIDCPLCGEPARHATSPVHPDTGVYNCSRCPFYGVEPLLHKQHRLVRDALADVKEQLATHKPQFMDLTPGVLRHEIFNLTNHDVVMAELKRRNR